MRISMKHCICIINLFVFILFGCGKEDTKQDEIPITTSSQIALDYFIQGRNANDLGNSDIAREYFESAINEDSNFCFAYLQRAYLTRTAADWKYHMDKAELNKENASEGERILVDIGWTYLDNDLTKRSDLLKKLMGKYPNSQRAKMIYAGCLSEMKEYDKAREFLHDAIEKSPKFALYHYYLANSYLFDPPTDYFKAEKYMSNYRNLLPNESMTYIGLGDVYRALGNLEKSKENYTKASELNPKYVTALFKKGHVNTQLGNYEEARNDYSKAQKIADMVDYSYYCNFYTYTFLYDGNFEEALSANTQLCEKMKNAGMPEDQFHNLMIRSLYIQTWIAMENGLIEKAKEATKKREKYIDLYLKSMESEIFTRNMETAKIYLETFIAAFENDFKTAIDLSNNYLKMIENESDPLKMEPYNRLLGFINLKQNNFDLAIEHFKKADLDNDLFDQYYNAIAYEKLNNIDEAKYYFQKVATNNFIDLNSALYKPKAIQKIDELN